MCNQVSGQSEASVYWWRRKLKAGGSKWGGLGVRVCARGGYCVRGYCEIGNSKQGGL